jgi:poly-gamma-glutamate capsule biosynthesis protein CapA/YwtB (metallophosphatase superfamily)
MESTFLLTFAKRYVFLSVLAIIVIIASAIAVHMITGTSWKWGAPSATNSSTIPPQPTSDPSLITSSPRPSMPSSTDQPENTQQPQVKDPSIEFHFTGDIMMDDVIGDYIERLGVDYPWTDVGPILASADIAAVNLETSVSTRGTTYKPTGYGFRSHPDTVQGLVNSGIDFVSLANNHSLDFGELALTDTLNTLDTQNIKYTGAGFNRKQAEQLAIVERKQMKIGFLSYTSILPNKSWIAQDDSAGVATLKPEYFDRILARIQEANEQVDLLVVGLHWGIEHSNQVESWQRELAKKMIDSGADVIVGHHPHVLRGIEIYKNKPILYSTGNFIFLKKDENAGKSAIFKVTMNRDGFVSGSLDPIYIQYGKANLLLESSSMYQQILANVRELSEPLGTQLTEQGSFLEK